MVMNVGVIVNKGFEKVAVSQVREILEDVKDIRVEDTIVIFEPSSLEEVYRFIYKSQIANRVIYLIDEFNYKTEDELLGSVGKSIRSKDDAFLKRLILNGSDFRATMNVDEHTDVTYLEAEIGGILIDHAQASGVTLKVNLKNPTLNLYVYVHNSHAYLGIDLSDDLSKRDYKIFNNAISLKGPTAFGLLMLAGYTPDDVYLNPCCYSGVLEIEAALYAAQMSHRYYNKSFPFMKMFPDTDWDRFFKKIDAERVEKKFPIIGSDKLLSSITAAVKNAKIAGVGSIIDFRRIDFDWMDIKFEKGEVDKIITFIQGSSNHDKNLAKDFKQIFYQAEYILKDSGKLVIMCLSKDLLIQSSEEYFDLDHEVTVHSGNQLMHVLFFMRKGGMKDHKGDEGGG
jgi:putative N6-adenine-specific DNA methylase